MTLQLKKFDPSTMGDDKICVFIGKRGTGKSTLVTDILWYKKNLPAGIAMSGTEDGNGHYKQFIPDIFVYSDFNKGALEKLLERQKKAVAAGRATPVFLLMDDCMYDKAFMRETCIRQLFMNGRHWKIFFMLTTQYCMDMLPYVRSNVDYVFVLRDNVKQNRENLYKAFLASSRRTTPSAKLWMRLLKTTSVWYWITHPSQTRLRTVCIGTRLPSGGISV